MTEQYAPEKGERARFTIEGIARPTGGGFFVDGAPHGRSFVHERQIVSVEKIGPNLPTGHGSVVRIIPPVGHAASLVRVYDASVKVWRTPYGDEAPAPVGNIEILYDAGESK